MSADDNQPGSQNPYKSPVVGGKLGQLSDRPTRIRWVVVALSFATSWLLYLHRYTFALIKPALVEEWDIGKDELGLLDSAFSVCYTTVQVPLGVLCDLAGAHLVLTGMILVWSLALAMHAFAPSVGLMWWARSLLGVGQSAVFAALTRITRTWVPLTIRATAQGIIGVFAGRLGGLSANLLFGFFLIGVLQMDWRTAVYLLAGLGVLQAIAFFALFRDSPRKHPWVNDAEATLIEGDDPLLADSGKSKPQKMSKRELLSRMSPRSILNLFALNVASILSTIADNIYSNWIPLFLFEVHALKFKEMGLYSALPLLGGALGGLAGGWMNDFFVARTGNRRWTRTGVAMTGKGLAAVTLFAALLTTYDNPYVFCLMLFFVKLFGDWSLTTSWATITDIGGKATASVFAFNNSVAGLGAMLAPVMYGFVAEYYNWKMVFVIACVTYALCALSWLLVNCTIPILREEPESKR